MKRGQLYIRGRANGYGKEEPVKQYDRVRRIKGRVTVRYSCNHTRDFEKGHEPNLFEDVFCLKCNKGVTVASVLPQWRWRCRKENCKSGRYYGQDERSCRTDAKEHIERRADHTCEILLGTDLVDSYGLDTIVPDRLGIREAQAQNSAILRGIKDGRVNNIVTVSLPEIP